MRVTKFEHATLTLIDAGKTLVIDPGSFTTPLLDLAAAVAVVITHEHPDHWTPDHLDRLLRNSPDAPIYGPEGVAKAAEEKLIARYGMYVSIAFVTTALRSSRRGAFVNTTTANCFSGNLALNVRYPAHAPP